MTRNAHRALDDFVPRGAGVEEADASPNQTGCFDRHDVLSVNQHEVGHRHEVGIDPGDIGEARGRILQSAWDDGAVDQGEQRRAQMDAAFLPLVQRERRSTSASRARIQPRELLTHACDTGGDCHLVATSLREKPNKIGAKVVSHGRFVTFQMAEVAIPRTSFAAIMQRITALRSPPTALAA
jgi:hypothetical protein